jgi:hypothetical protein
MAQRETSLSSSSAAPSGATSSSPPPNSPDTSKNSGLSIGISVDIDVGAGVVGLAAIIGGGWFALRSKKKYHGKLADDLPAYVASAHCICMRAK